MLEEDALRAPRPGRRQLPVREVRRERRRALVRRRVCTCVLGCCGKRTECHADITRTCYIRDSDRISCAALDNSCSTATSGRTVTSTNWTLRREPSFGSLDAIDGTCSVTPTTRHIVLGRLCTPSRSSVSSCSTSPRAGTQALWHSANTCSLRSRRTIRSVNMGGVAKLCVDCTY